MDTAGWYRMFAEREARGQSLTYERLALAVAADNALLRLLEGLPRLKRQPNLLFAAARLHGAPLDDPAAFRDWVLGNWDDLAHTIRMRRTQTNEPGRCAVMLPVLAALPQPLALLEIGASAGLCLYPDLYSYRYGGHAVGPVQSQVRLDCAVSGDVPLPERVPTVVWRAGIDVNPLDVDDEEDLRWLDALIWPEHAHRASRVRAAAGIARADPPRIVRGDLLVDLPALAAQAPAHATLVVFHSAVLAYVAPETRAAFAAFVATLPGHWISNEGPRVLPEVSAPIEAHLPASDESAEFVLALDGRPLALTGPHGQSMRWLARTPLLPHARAARSPQG